MWFPQAKYLVGPAFLFLYIEIKSDQGLLHEQSSVANLADIYDMHIILWTNFYSWTILFRNLPDINWFTVTYSVFSQSRCRLSGKEISIDFWELIGSRRELFATTTRLLRSLWKIPFWFTVLDLPYSIE